MICTHGINPIAELRFLVALPWTRDLLLFAKHLFAAARTMRCSHHAASAAGGLRRGRIAGLPIVQPRRRQQPDADQPRDDQGESASQLKQLCRLVADLRERHHTCLASRISVASTYGSLRQRLALRSASARLPAHSARL